MDIHNYDHMYDRTRKSIQEADITKENKALILNFADDLALDNISKPRIIRYFHTLKPLAREIPDLDKATKEDVKRVVSRIQQNSEYSPHTKHTYKILIRRFFKWLRKTEDYPEEVKWIKTNVTRSQMKLPCEGDLLNEQDVQKLIQAANHPRDKAFISTLWESGARVGEIGNLQIKNVSYDKYGVVITVQGKTGSRKIRLISSTPYLSTWMNNHPFKDSPESPLWINVGTTNHKKVMHYRNMRNVVIKIAELAQIHKRCNPHSFRHSRATYMANHLTEFQMNQYFGWIQGSDMPSTYVHMSGREVDNAILQMNGIETGIKKEESKLQPRICTRCDTINSADSKHCNKCGGILDIKTLMEIEQKEAEQLKDRSQVDMIMGLIMNDKDIQIKLLEKLKNLNLSL